MELEPAPDNFAPPDDRRPRMEEPIPVRLIAVADVRLLTPPQNHQALDHLYVRLLRFVPHSRSPLRYRADNFILHFEERPLPIEYPDLKPLGIEIPSLPIAEKKLFDAEIPYTRQRHVAPGRESLLLRDPGGNWIELVENRRLI